MKRKGEGRKKNFVAKKRQTITGRVSKEKKVAEKRMAYRRFP
jgi:hypothetical protein